MRILVAAERLGPAGGMERYLEVVLAGLATRGATAHVLARVVERVPAGVTAQRLAWADEHHPPDDGARRAAAAALAAFAPDVVLAQNVMDAGVVEALRAAPRLAYAVHDHRPFCPNGDRVYPRSGRICTAPLGTACALHALLDGCAYGPRRRTLALIARRRRLRDAIAAADSTLVASDYVAARAVASGIPAARIARVPPPLPDDAYADPAPRTPDAGAPARTTDAAGAACAAATICFAGRMVPQKGLVSLVRALGRIAPQRRPRLRAFGDGPQRARAAQEAAARGVALETPGELPVAQVRAGLDAAALVVLPSLWAEPFGMVGIEAFARGRPVVAYDVGGVRSWLDDGVNGLAVAAGDEAALARAIETLLADGPLRARLGARARTDAERYRLDPALDVLLAAVVRDDRR